MRRQRHLDSFGVRQFSMQPQIMHHVPAGFDAQVMPRVALVDRRIADIEQRNLLTLLRGCSCGPYPGRRRVQSRLIIG